MFLGHAYNRLIATQHKSLPIYNNRRFTHTFIVGKTGVGKSTLLENLAIQDVLNGEGVAFFDPHGDSIDTIMNHIPPEKVILVDPTDEEFVVSLNPLNDPQNITFTVATLVDTFASTWDIDLNITTHIYQYLLYGLTALAYAPEGTLFGFRYLINSKSYRDKVLRHVKDDFVRDWWEIDFDERIPDKEQRTNTISTLSRFAALFIDPKLRCVFGDSESRLKLDRVLDKGKCLLIKLPQGKMGIKKSATVGALLMAQLHIAALKRKDRRPFHIYADEAHHFGSSTLEEMLSGVRKFGVSLVLANQYLGQFSPSMQEAILGTIGTIVAFPVGIRDAETLAKEMTLSSNELIEQEPFFAWVKTDKVYDVDMPGIYHKPYPDSPRQIKLSTRNQFARPLEEVEEKLDTFMWNVRALENKNKRGR